MGARTSTSQKRSHSHFPSNHQYRMLLTFFSASNTLPDPIFTKSPAESRIPSRNNVPVHLAEKKAKKQSSANLRQLLNIYENVVESRSTFYAKKENLRADCAERIKEVSKNQRRHSTETGSIDTTATTRTGIDSSSSKTAGLSAIPSSRKKIYGQIACQPTCKQVIFARIKSPASNLRQPVAYPEKEAIASYVHENRQDSLQPLSSKGYYPAPIVQAKREPKKAQLKHVRLKVLNGKYTQSAQQPIARTSTKEHGNDEIKKCRESARNVVRSYAEKKRVWKGANGKFSKDKLADWYAWRKDVG